MTCSEIAVSTTSVNFLTDVIVPLLSALIGGLMALVGVYITLCHDRKLRSDERSEMSRPFFCTIDYGDSRIVCSNNHIFLFSPIGTVDYDDHLAHIQGNFINSSKIEFIIEKITIGEHCYLPLRPEMIEKGMTFMIKLNYSENLAENKVILHITDINNQKRMYHLILESDKVVCLVEL